MNRASPSGSVCMSCERVAISGHMKLFQDQMNDRITLVAAADLASGIITFQMIRHSDRPSTRAASISERGTASKLALNTKMQMIGEHRQSEAKIGIEEAE